MENTKPQVEEKEVATPAVTAPVKNVTTPVKNEAPKATSEAAPKKVNKVVIKNTLGKEVPISDYFYKGIVDPGFEGTCGKPVDRDDLLDIFHKVFKPSDNILFYKQTDKEVYLVIIPIKYSVSVGDFNDSLDGDFQKHAISFLNEGSVNLDTLRQKLERITKFVKYDNR